jgi:putative NADH-flavin reductase
MKILILGATGRTGKLILKEALDRGYEVNCLVRDPAKVRVEDSSLTVFKGTPENIADLEESMKDCHAIISALNISRTSDFPWAKLRTPPTFLSDVMDKIISLSKKMPIKRIIVCSAWGVSETEKDIPGWFRWFINNSNIGVAYKDHERQEDMLKQSNLNWTIVRPVGLSNSTKVKKVIESYENQPKPKLTISRRNLAHFMVDALKRDDLIGKLPVLSE